MEQEWDAVRCIKAGMGAYFLKTYMGQKIPAALHVKSLYEILFIIYWRITLQDMENQQKRSLGKLRKLAKNCCRFFKKKTFFRFTPLGVANKEWFYSSLGRSLRKNCKWSALEPLPILDTRSYKRIMLTGTPKAICTWGHFLSNFNRWLMGNFDTLTAVFINLTWLETAPWFHQAPLKLALDLLQFKIVFVIQKRSSVLTSSS